MYKFIEKEILKGRQAFIICPLIEESENSESKSVKEEYQKIKKNIQYVQYLIHQIIIYIYKKNRFLQ